MSASRLRGLLGFSPGGCLRRLESYNLALLCFIPIYTFLVLAPGFSYSRWLLFVFAANSLKLLGATYVLLLISLPVRFAAERRRGTETPARQLLGEIAKPFLTWAFMLRTANRIFCVFGAIYLFLHLKQLILWWHPANYDLTLWNLDRELHFGVQPNVWAMNLVGDHQLTAVAISWLYVHYFQYMLLVSTVFLLEPRGKRLSDQYFCAYTLLWCTAGLVYVGLPADGPCYAILGPEVVPADHSRHMFSFPVTSNIPPSYAEQYLEAKIFIDKFHQERLWVDREEFLTGQHGPLLVYGIAAMPSLHVGATVMMTLFLFRVSSLAGLCSAVYALIICFGSVYLQWHYAVDGYAGIALALLVTWLSRLRSIAERFDRASKTVDDDPPKPGAESSIAPIPV